MDDDVLSEGEYSEEELGSLAVNLGSLHQPGGSDTEGDFLDKCEIKNKNKSRPDKEEQSVNNSAPDNHRDNKVSQIYILLIIFLILMLYIFPWLALY